MLSSFLLLVVEMVQSQNREGCEMCTKLIEHLSFRKPQGTETAISMKEKKEDGEKCNKINPIA